MGTNRQLLVLMLTGSCVMLPNCSERRLSYSSPAGMIDQQPAAFWGPQYAYHPPEIDGRPFDPTGGLGIQKFADRLIGKRIATFVGHGWDPLRSGLNVNVFFTPAELGPGPGTCAARRFEISSDYSKGASGEVKRSDGEWRKNVYAVAGSVAPLSGPWPQEYKVHLLQECRKRSDMDMWYSAEPGQAYLAARLADAVVATASRPGELPFRLGCTPYSEPASGKPQCEADVRKSVASINPRAIIQVDDCSDTNSPICLAIQFPKKPERSTRIESRWTLNVHLDRRGREVQYVDVEDTEMIIE